MAPNLLMYSSDRWGTLDALNFRNNLKFSMMHKYIYIMYVTHEVFYDSLYSLVLNILCRKAKYHGKFLKFVACNFFKIF